MISHKSTKKTSQKEQCDFHRSMRNGALNVHGGGAPIGVGRCGIGAVQIHIKHRSRGMEKDQHPEDYDPLVSTRFHTVFV